MLSKTKQCPKCEEELNTYARACSCGWKESKKKKEWSRRCGFMDNGRQCPLPATIDDSTCRFHVGWWDNPRMAALNLDEILNGTLVIKKENWREEVIREFQTKHPEFAIVPTSTEEIKDYIGMTKKFIRNAATLPYDKNKSYDEQKRLSE